MKTWFEFLLLSLIPYIIYDLKFANCRDFLGSVQKLF